jgi:hypothetical protein
MNQIGGMAGNDAASGGENPVFIFALDNGGGVVDGNVAPAQQENPGIGNRVSLRAGGNAAASQGQNSNGQMSACRRHLEI